MRGARRGFCFLPFLLAIAGAPALAQPAASASSDSHPKDGPQIAFQYENPQLQPAKYTFVIYEDGSGEFHSQQGATPPLDTASYQPLAGPLDRTVQLSRSVVEQIFSAARRQKFFAIACENPKDKVAFQGTKQLSYLGPDGSGTCTYNWSRLVPIEKVTSIFESIAFTLEEGRRLEVEHKHDRLALDAELGTLLDAAKDGRAMEFENIKPVLQAIVEDASVLDRARSRAQKLIAGSDVSRASLPPS